MSRLKTRERRLKVSRNDVRDLVKRPDVLEGEKATESAK
jgi:hypothetical protein